ncbi:MAG: hypothetical protein CYPHOPRED_001631 [Cyphobasidiales sp. Tagirdzhanova-0007]|nr:MAG: hypothetical protein CYPHOPRED_001631 [Cyphobasidiales sp. Tagirdzhanova-0007]
MSYEEVLYDADGARPSNELAFKDFGTASIPADSTGSTGRISPSAGTRRDATSRLFEGDAGSQRANGGEGGSNRARWLSPDTYSSWFDVDTVTVCTRSYLTLYPREDYLAVVLNNAPDLYGPFWVPTTLIFALFLTSSLSSSIQAYLAGNTYNYDFTRLSVAVSVVYTYALAVPVGLWAVMRYWAGVDERGPVDMVSVYGYSTTIWIFVALFTIPPIPILRFVFSLTAFLLSGFFLLRNIYPVLSTAQSKAARILILAVALLHFGFATLLWFYFLNAGEIKVTPTD